MRDIARIGMVGACLALGVALAAAPGCNKGGDEAPTAAAGDGAATTDPTPADPAGDAATAAPSAASASLSPALTAALEKIPAGDKDAAPPDGTDADAGKAKYDALCASCHGATGKGDGAAAAFLDPRPGDWTSAARADQTTAGQKVWLIANGVGGGSAMPGFSGTLSEEETWAVVAYIETLK